MIKIAFRAMGCDMAAFLDDESPAAFQLLEQVPGWFEEWEQALSRFRPESELCRMNAANSSARSAASTLFQASPVLCEVVSAALAAARRTGGLVTPTLLGQLEQAGYRHSFELMPLAGLAALPEFELAEAEVNLDGWQEIEVDLARGWIRLPIGVRLDLGGVAKGWAAWQAAERLAALAPALVDAGGDIAASGLLRDGSPWPVAVADVYHPPVGAVQPPADLALLAGGLPGSRGIATSGIDYRRWQVGSDWMHHIIDPRTGHPARTDLIAVTVSAPDAQLAEAAAKTVLILGSRAGVDWLEALPGHSGLLVLQDGRMLYAGNMSDIIWRPS